MRIQSTVPVSYTHLDVYKRQVKQSVSDWFYPQSYAGESVVATTAYRLTSTGAADIGPCYLYGYSFALNSAKTVESITLPNNASVVVLAMTVSP